MLPRMTHVRFIRRGLYFSTNLEYCRLRTRPSCFGWTLIRPATRQRQPVYIRPLSSAHSRPVRAAPIPLCLASQTGGARTRHVRTHPEHTLVPNRRCPCSRRRKHYWNVLCICIYSITSLSVSLSLPVSLSPLYSLQHYLWYVYECVGGCAYGNEKHTYTHTNTRGLFLSLSLPLTHTHVFKISSLSLSLSLSVPLSASLSLMYVHRKSWYQCRASISPSLCPYVSLLVCACVCFCVRARLILGFRV